ncbi:MAG TPA: fimbrial protein [Buttiauxella sp.]|uniref:fimbrial protein n=1 Tax=Buttiauxella sp. TaxID=1972222 RepID=UPI002B48130F|nr:fimbrial protein [Buttiauxella sp.]HKM95724.1 fimbrial protein [Buttiauxella sp.]
MKYLFVFIALLISGYVSAACVTATNDISTISPGNMIVQRDAPVGTIIGSFRTVQVQAIIALCYPSGTRHAYFDYMGAVAISPGLYQTNIPGVGIYQENADTHVRTFTSTSTTITMGTPGFNGVINIWPGADSNIVFVKTGNITSGFLQPGMISHQVVADDGGTMREIDLTGGSVTQVACSIKTPNLVFPLGDVPVSTFGNTIGFIPDVSTTQNLGLDCDAGANINVSLNGTQNPDSSDASVLALNNQGGSDVASGVGIQLLYNDAPLALNNTIVLKNSPGGVETFPLKARFIQTQTTVTAGDASTNATLQLTYQ